MNIYKEQSKNSWRTWFLMTTFFVLVILVGFIFSEALGDSTFLYIAIIFSLVMNVVSYWYSDKIALSMSHARPTSKQENEMLWNVVENLSITAGLPMPKVYIINDPSPNAFATGRNKEHAAIAVTSGLLSVLNRTELEGVIAHELAHIGNKDILISTVAIVLVGFISILSDMFLRISFWGGGRDNREGGQAGAIIAILSIFAVIVAPIAATLIQLAISRKREFLADSTGALLTRYPEGLASALEKIGGYSQGLSHASNATAHLFISNPFGAKAMKGLGKLFMTHPPMEERIAILRGKK